MSEKIMLILTFSICAVFLTIPFVNAQFPENGVVGYWSFDVGTINGNTVKDLLGENDGELEGNPKVVNGKVGKALEFNGDNAVRISGTDMLNFNGAEEMSVVAWVNPASAKPVRGVIPDQCCGTIVGQRDAESWVLRFDGRNGVKRWCLLSNRGGRDTIHLVFPHLPKTHGITWWESLIKTNCCFM